jgi:D-glucosaminate-6-phosphate ammonia-lyase
MSLYERLGVERVINASGRMTALGGATLAPVVTDAMVEAAGAYVDLAEFKARAARRIAALCGAEDAFPTAGAAAGIVAMVAAAVAGSDPARVAALPDADWERREVVLQAGHLVDFGAPVEQMVRLGGGRPRPVGAVNAVSAEALAAALGARTAAVLFVQSHHSVRKGQLPLAEVIAIAHSAELPVLVDAAAEESLDAYLAMGADLVAYSGGKAFEGPTSGFVVGRRDLVEACRAQERGVLRPMKIGKEALAGLVAALEAYAGRDDAALRRLWDRRVEAIAAGLADVPGLRVAVEVDEAGRAIRRVALSAAPGSNLTMVEVARALARGTPPVVVRGHRLAEGVALIDPRPLASDDVDTVVRRVREAVAAVRAAGGASARRPPRRRARRLPLQATLPTVERRQQRRRPRHVQAGQAGERGPECRCVARPHRPRGGDAAGEQRLEGGAHGIGGEHAAAQDDGERFAAQARASDAGVRAAREPPRRLVADGARRPVAGGRLGGHDPRQGSHLVARRLAGTPIQPAPQVPRTGGADGGGHGAAQGGGRRPPVEGTTDGHQRLARDPVRAPLVAQDAAEAVGAMLAARPARPLERAGAG